MYSLSRYVPTVSTGIMSSGITSFQTCGVSRQIITKVAKRQFSSKKVVEEDMDEVNIQASTPLKLDSNKLFHLGFKVIPQGHVALVERLGKFHQIMEPGLHFLIPVVDCIKHSFPLMRVSFSVTPQEAYTKDNVKVKLGGDIIVRITDPKAAAYGAGTPFSLATIYAQAAMRNAIGELSLDDLLNQREIINRKVFEAVNKHTNSYGLECLGYEIKGLKVPQHIEDEMSRQVTSERKRRETVLNSQGEREAAINKAEGQKISSQLSSEGEKISKINQAEGNAQQRLIEAKAEAEALREIGKAIRENPEAAATRVASEALRVWQGMIGHSNTMIIPANVSPIEVLLPQALAAYTRSTEVLKTTLKPEEIIKKD